MGRKLSTEKREKFLAAALKLFVANGVGGTSTSEIASEAGTAAGTLFLYFPTKHDLVNQLVIQLAHAQAARIDSLLNFDLPTREMFLTIWKGSIDWFLQNMPAYLYIRQVRDSGLIAEEVVQETNQYFTYYYQAIQKGHKEGSIKPYPSELTGSFLYQGIIAVMDLIRGQPDQDKQSTYIQLGFEMFWNGIKSEAK